MIPSLRRTLFQTVNGRNLNLEAEARMIREPRSGNLHYDTNFGVRAGALLAGLRNERVLGGK